MPSCLVIQHVEPKGPGVLGTILVAAGKPNWISFATR